MAEFDKGKGYSKIDLVAHGFHIILYGRMYTHYQTVINEIDTFVENDESCVRSLKDDVIIPASGETTIDIARASVVPYQGIILGGDINIIKTNKKILNPIFLALTLSNGKQQKELSKKAQGKSVVHLYNSELKKVIVDFPKIEEQIAIGKLFEELENLISLQKRKLEKLKELKRAYLQQMFPFKSTPQIRFQNFSQTWKLGTLGNYLLVSEKIKATISDSNDLMTLKLNLGGLELGTNRETLDFGSTVYYRRKSGQFIYGKQNFFNGSMAIIPAELDGKATSGDVPSLDIYDINPDYLYRYVSRKSYWSQKKSSALGTGSKRIHESTLLGFEIDVPEIEEQSQIASLFENLDFVINFHHQKLNSLSKLKQSYLQKMFI